MEKRLGFKEEDLLVYVTVRYEMSILCGVSEQKGISLVPSDDILTEIKPCHYCSTIHSPQTTSSGTSITFIESICKLNY